MKTLILIASIVLVGMIGLCIHSYAKQVTEETVIFYKVR